MEHMSDIINTEDLHNTISKLEKLEQEKEELADDSKRCIC